MALTKCKECGKDISNKAKSCPYCGAPIKGTSPFPKIVIIIIVLCAIGYFSNSSKTSRMLNSSPQYDSLGSSSDHSSVAEETPSIEVISWRCEKENNFVFVRGEIKNISSRSIKNVMVVAEFRTKDGTFVKSEDALIEYNPILPGQTSPFEVVGTDNPAITKCGISFKTLLGKRLSYTISQNNLDAEKKKIWEVQRLLLGLGYKIGATDGVLGPKTQKAIRDFQRKRGLPQTGKVSNRLISELQKYYDTYE